ncbi:Tobamovirus multiplication protein 2A [Zea mays]|uniref:Tobamovirus multiplication protein 2A n=1 Tax=Zea mays TaxID=4577 RepID=K7VGM3_MAIZE|nr:Tobamovirus multiplication protein 2A [Zea mays]
MAACRGFFECLLRLLNFILTVAGLAMVGYGIYLLVEWMKISEDGIGGASTAEVLVSGRPLLGAVILGDSFLDNLPKAWFIYLFICVGTIVILVSLFGCIGAGTRNTCCLCFVSCYVPLRRHYVVLSKEDSICHAQDTKKYLELCSTLIPDGILLVAEHVNQQNFVSVLL